MCLIEYGSNSTNDIQFAQIIFELRRVWREGHICERCLMSQIYAQVVRRLPSLSVTL